MGNCKNKSGCPNKLKKQLANIDWKTVYQIENCGDTIKIIPFEGNEYYVAATLADIFYRNNKRTHRCNSDNRMIRNFILTHLYMKQKT